jgi:flavin-dependent dehydrogenase
MSDSILDVAILGAGPGGLSAAARAAQRRLSHVLLEAADKHANTIQRYQRLKHVMSEPGVLPLRSDIEFTAGRREEVLETWEKGIAEKECASSTAPRSRASAAAVAISACSCAPGAPSAPSA